MLKHVFFDFDSTLAIHKPEFCNIVDITDVLEPLALRHIDIYGESCCDKHVKRFWDICKEKTHEMPYVISWMSSNILLPCKVNFIKNKVDEDFPAENFILSGTREDKLRILNTLCKHWNCDKSEILIVEDHPATMNELVCDGFKVCAVQNIFVELDLTSLFDNLSDAKWR